MSDYSSYITRITMDQTKSPMGIEPVSINLKRRESSPSRACNGAAFSQQALLASGSREYSRSLGPDPCGESVPSSSATTLVSCQATRCERLALCRQLILSAKWAAATPVAALPLAGHQQALTGNNNDLTFAIRL